jgi:hypothetical protein
LGGSATGSLSPRRQGSAALVEEGHESRKAKEQKFFELAKRFREASKRPWYEDVGSFKLWGEEEPPFFVLRM